MTSWFLLIGVVLVGMAFAGRAMQPLPLSPAIVYLAVGYLIGSAPFGLLLIEPLQHMAVIEVLAEVAVLVTLFSVGLRLQVSLRYSAWRVSLRLATVGMVLTIIAATVFGVLLLDLPVTVALLLAAVLAPTDPVLASDVQIRAPTDRDQVRMSLTAEGAINDGAAFPAVMLALGLLAVHAPGFGPARAAIDNPLAFGIAWFVFDLCWGVGGALLIGWLGGQAVGAMAHRFQDLKRGIEAEEYLVCGVIALVYGSAVLLRTYGFLAVLAAGLALAHIERGSRKRPSTADESAAAARAPLVHVRRFVGQAESLCEVALVLLIGAALASVTWSWQLVLFALAMMLIVRPLAVAAAIPSAWMPRNQRLFIAWFGIRGVGSLYYLAYALRRQPAYGDALLDTALATIALSIVLHGISATPLMAWREARWPRTLGK